MSSFTRNVLTLTGGTVVAQLLPVLAVPVLARLYTPTDFGTLSIYIAIVGILGSIAAARFDLAVMLPEDDRQACDVAALGITLSFIVALLSLLGILLVYAFWPDDWPFAPGYYWYLTAPICIFLTGVFNCLSRLATRQKEFGQIAKATISKAFALVTTQLVVGVFVSGPSGLILGQIASATASNGRLFWKSRLRQNLGCSFRLDRMAMCGSRYRDFPLFSMPAIFANTLATQLSSLAIGGLYSLQILGHYSMAQRLLGMPTLLIGNAVSQVYFEQAARERRLTGNARVTFGRTTITLHLISLLFFVPAWFFVVPLCTLVLGDSWTQSAEISQLLIPLFAVRFVVTAVTTTNTVFEKQRISLWWQLGLLIVYGSTITAAWYLKLSLVNYLIITVVAVGLHYLLLLLLLWKVAQGEGEDLRSKHNPIVCNS